MKKMYGRYAIGDKLPNGAILLAFDAAPESQAGMFLVLARWGDEYASWQCRDDGRHMFWGSYSADFVVASRRYAVRLARLREIG